MHQNVMVSLILQISTALLGYAPFFNHTHYSCYPVILAFISLFHPRSYPKSYEIPNMLTPISQYHWSDGIFHWKPSSYGGTPI